MTLLQRATTTPTTTPAAPITRPTTHWALTAVSLLAAVWLGLGAGDGTAHWVVALGALAALVALIGAALLLKRATRPATHTLRTLAGLAPTALLMSVFPAIGTTFTTTRIGTSPTLLVVLAVSVTVPWLCGIVAAGAYTPLADNSRSSQASFYTAFYAILPSLAAWALLPIGAFTLLSTALLDFSTPAAALYATGLATNALFALVLIPLTETHRSLAIIASWAAYALALLIAPAAWFAVPLAGVFVAALTARAGLGGLRRPRRLGKDTMLPAQVEGFYSSATLWVDKYILIMVFGLSLDVYLIYVALIPMVIAQALYFGRVYDSFHHHAEKLTRMIATTPAGALAKKQHAIASRIEAALAVTLTLAAILTIALVSASANLGLHGGGLLLALVIAPIGFLGANLAAFQINQLGSPTTARTLGLIHIIATTAALLLLPMTGAYILIIAVDLALILYSLKKMRALIQASAFTLFWKEAVAW